MMLLSVRKVRVPSRNAKPSTASMNPADQLRRRNSPSVTDGRPSDSWKATISRMLSSWIFRNSLSSRHFALCARAASSKRCGRRKLPICSTRNGGWMPPSSPHHPLAVNIHAASGRAAAFPICCPHPAPPPPPPGCAPPPAGGPAAHGADERALGTVLVIGHRAHDSANADAEENPRLHALEGAAAGSLHVCATCERDAHCRNHHISLHTTSVRRIFAPSTMAFIFPKATSRGRYFIPQSGARMTSSFFKNWRAFLIRSATCCGASTVLSERSRQPTMIFLPCNFASTAQSSLDCAVSIETCEQEQPASSGRKE